MKGNNHLVAGVAVAGCMVASAWLDEQHQILPIIGMAGAAVLGSLFPDIDSRTSKLGSKMRITSWLASKVFGHRGFLHSPMFVALIFLLCHVLFKHYEITQYNLIYYGFAGGMLMHLMCDIVTRGGIPLLYPFNRKKFSIGTMASGHKYEIISLILILLLTGVITYLMLQNHIYLSVICP